MPVVQPDDGAAAWFQHAAHFREGAFDRGRVMQHAEAVDDVEARGVEGHRLGVAVDRIRREAFEREVLRGVLQVAATEIKRRHLVAVAREAVMIAPEADTDFEHALAADRVELHDVVEPGRVLGVADAPGLAIERERPWLILWPDRARAARVTVPLLLRLPFVDLE